MMGRWGLEGMGSFEQMSVSRKEGKNVGRVDVGDSADVRQALASEAA